MVNDVSKTMCDVSKMIRDVSKIVKEQKYLTNCKSL